MLPNTNLMDNVKDGIHKMRCVNMKLWNNLVEWRKLYTFADEISMNRGGTENDFLVLRNIRNYLTENTYKIT